MAPIFSLASPAGGTTSQKPAFSFNMQNSHGNNFFSARPAASGMHTQQQQDQQMDGSWDMGDDVSDGTHNDNDNDDSRALEYHNGDGNEQEDTMLTVDSNRPGLFDTYSEFDAFAVCLDNSRLLQYDDPNSTDAAASGYDLISHLQEVSMERVKVIKDNISEELTGEELADLAYWQLEEQTWGLFGTLMSHRVERAVRIQELPNDLAHNKYTSNERFREYLRETDVRFKEWSLILQWLWGCAPSPADVYDEDGVRYGSKWMYTKESLKSQKRLAGKKMLSLQANSNKFFGKKADMKNLVTELDPDAPSRQQRQLEEEDEEAERNFMKLIWAFIRKGDVDGANQACVDFGEWWRCASLSGGEEAWDHNIDGRRLDTKEEDDEANGIEPATVVGNRRRELWKRMCFAIARKHGGDEWEKAVYGALCGDVESVQKVCNSWEDHLFAHMNSLVEEYYTSYLVAHSRIPSSVTKFPIFNSTAFHSKSDTLDDDTILERIINSLSAAEVLKNESRMPLRIIQGSLISSRLNELAEEFDRQIQHFGEDPNYNPLVEEGSSGLDATEQRSLRVVVHMLLVTQLLNGGFTANTPYLAPAENIIAAYIEFLSDCGKNELIPLYAGRLSPEKAVEVMGKILTKVKDDSQRLGLLKLMRMHNINVEGCLVRTMEICLEDTEESYEQDGAVRLSALKGDGLKGELREEDDMLVRGLEWLVLGGDGLKDEVIRKGVVVYKRFLLAGRLSAAKVVYDKISTASILDMPEHSGHGFNLNTSITKRFPSEEAYWLCTIYVEIEGLVRSLMALEAWNETLKKQPERSDRRTWKTTLSASYDDVHSKLADTVKNWLEDALADAPSSFDTSFIRELRNIYIPELTFALHELYVEASKWISKTLLANCLELATVVADPGRSVLNTFIQTGRVEEYVCAVAGASRSVLGAGMEKSGLGIWNVR